MQKNQQVMYPEEREYSWQDGKKLRELSIRTHVKKKNKEDKE